MRSKQQLLDLLRHHARQLDPPHNDLAAIAIIETEIQIDIRDILEQRLISLDNTILKYIIPKGG